MRDTAKGHATWQALLGLLFQYPVMYLSLYVLLQDLESMDAWSSNELQWLQLTHCGLVKPHGVRDLAWRHQAITWTNVDWSSVKSSDIHIRAISQEMPQPLITQIPWKITYLKFHSNFPGANRWVKSLHLASESGIYGCLIFKWVAMTSVKDYGNRTIVIIMAARVKCPIWENLINTNVRICWGLILNYGMRYGR